MSDKIKYYIKATLPNGKSPPYEDNLICHEGYNRHPNPIKNNKVYGAGKIQLYTNIKNAISFVNNAENFYVALPFWEATESPRP